MADHVRVPQQGPTGYIRGLTFFAGDFGSLAQLFFDNLSTLLGVVFAITSMEIYGVSRDVINNIVYGSIVPGLGISLAVGGTYYACQATRVSNHRGYQYTAQPCGINTPASFAFVYNIMTPVLLSEIDAGAAPDDAFMTAYRVSLAGNFVVGLVMFGLGIFGPQILDIVPPAALLVPIAGIGFASLGLQQVAPCLAAPMVGFVTIVVMFMGWYGFVQIVFRKIRMPEALQVILIGVALGWATGLNKASDVTDAAKLAGWWGPTWAAKDLFSDFSRVSSYLGIIIPIGIASAASTLMCLVSAKTAGEPYPVRETMFFDAFNTVLTAFFGSPFGTVVYVGHPAHKRSGAKTGYSLMNGWIFFVLSWLGLFALVSSVVNAATIGPIVLFVGLMICEECLNFIPQRHNAVFIFGIFASVFDWAVNQAGRVPIITAEGYNSNVPALSNDWWGVLAFKRGALLVSLLWSAMVTQIIDRKWAQAGLWALVAAFFACFGIIHSPKAGFDTFTSPFEEQCIGTTTNGELVVTCWDQAEQWMFLTAYAMLAALFFGTEACRRWGAASGDDSVLLTPIVDAAYTDAFKDWYTVDSLQLAAVDVAISGTKSAMADPNLRINMLEESVRMAGLSRRNLNLDLPVPASRKDSYGSSSLSHHVKALGASGSGNGGLNHPRVPGPSGHAGVQRLPPQAGDGSDDDSCAQAGSRSAAIA